MLTIAEREIGTLLAVAKISCATFFSLEGFRSEFGALVRSITKRLIGRFPTGTKIVFFACREIDTDWFIVSYNGFFHKYWELNYDN